MIRSQIKPGEVFRYLDEGRDNHWLIASAHPDRMPRKPWPDGVVGWSYPWPSGLSRPVTLHPRQLRVTNLKPDRLAAASRALQESLKLLDD